MAIEHPRCDASLGYCSHIHNLLWFSLLSGQFSAQIAGALIKLWQVGSSNNPHHLSVGWCLHLCCRHHWYSGGWEHRGNIWKRIFSVMVLSKSFHSDWADMSVRVLCVWTCRRWGHLGLQQGLEGCLFLQISLKSACHKGFSSSTTDPRQFCVQQEHEYIHKT